MPTKSGYTIAQNLGPDQSYVVVIEKLITAIGQETNKKRILGAVLPYALTVSGTETGVLLVTRDAKSFQAVARLGVSKEVVRQLTGGDLGNLLLMGQRLWMKPQPMQLNPEQALLGRHHLKYMFGLPLRFAGRILGAIVVGSHHREYHTLTPVQQQRLNTIAHLVALFLDDLRLRTQNATLVNQGKASSPSPQESPGALAEYEHDLEQLLAAVMNAEEEVASQNVDLGLLNSLSTKMIGALQTKQVLSTAIKQTGEAMQADAAWCYLMQDGELMLSGQHGLSDKYVENMAHLSPGTGAEGMAFTRQEPILRDALLFHSGKMRGFVQAEGLVAIAAVPLFAGGEPYGVLAVANRRNREWSERDRRMLVSIGQRVEQAIVNSQKFTAATEKASTLEHQYQALQQSNTDLVHKAAALEQQLQTLRQAEQQLWVALAASQHARRNSISTEDVDESLINSLKEALMARQR